MRVLMVNYRELAAPAAWDEDKDRVAAAPFGGGWIRYGLTLA